MRIYFHSTAVSLHRHIEGVPYSNGTFAPAYPTISQLRPGFDTTGNRGNMIHSEAIMRILDRNVGRCASGNLHHLSRQLGDRFTSEMNRQFDAVVLSMANCVTKNRDAAGLVDALERLEVPIYVFGVGMQDALPKGRLDLLTPSTQRLVEIFGQAEFFSVRGRRTAAWLRSVGHEPDTIGGCPSLYLFPQRIAALDFAAVPRADRLVTGGHISENNLNGSRPRFKRGHQLVDAFRGTPATYVFQDEPFHYSGLVEEPDVYDASLCEIDAPRLNSYMQDKVGVSLPFDRYLFFHDPATWRVAMRGFDAFVGDRFHGGVACLQASVPAAFVTSDQRMTELAEYYRLPSTTFADLDGASVPDVLDSLFTSDANDAFHERYRARLQRFQKDLRNAGLPVADPRPIDQLLGG